MRKNKSSELFWQRRRRRKRAKRIFQEKLEEIVSSEKEKGGEVENFSCCEKEGPVTFEVESSVLVKVCPFCGMVCWEK